MFQRVGYGWPAFNLEKLITMTEDKAKSLISKGLAVLTALLLIVALVFIPYLVGQCAFAISGEEKLLPAESKWGFGLGAIGFGSFFIAIGYLLLRELASHIKSKL